MLSDRTNPFLQDNFAPVDREITAPNLPVSGTIPPALQGTFVRNGPNPQFPLPDYHWFDGDGMLHAVEIKQGQATYRNRYVETAGYLKEKELGQAIAAGILNDPQNNPNQDYKNASNTALVWHKAKLLSLWEAGQPYQIGLPNLDTLGLETFHGKLDLPFTAHPKVDPVTQEMMFISYRLLSEPYLHYGIVNSQGEIAHLIPIDLPVGVMMHDFAISANYSILMNLPLTFRVSRLAEGKSPFQFESKIPSYFGILPRHGHSQDIIWLEAPSCYVFHTLNAYEEGDEVILLACRMAATNVLGTIDDPTLEEKAGIPLLTRWRFNLQDKSVKEETLSPIPCEFPRLNENYLGRKNRYGYAARAQAGAMPLFAGVIKYDFLTDTLEQHDWGSDRYGGEVVFVPNPENTAEDGGWLMTFVYDSQAQSSELVILDAQNLTAPPLARIPLPQRVPYGFHGIWVGEC
jgi:carotenoid cleavage dioxygenase